MHSILSFTAVISVLTCVIKSAPSPGTNLPFSNHPKRSDTESSGNYLIAYCGPQLPAVQTLIRLMQSLLGEAIDQLPSPAGNGRGSKAYDAFFNGVDPMAVQAVYQNMIAGTNISVSGKSVRPDILCVNDNPHPLMVRVRAACGEQSGGTVLGMQMRGSQFVFLCPVWREVIPFPFPYQCGSVDSTNTLSTPVNLATTQYTNLVHELAHLYIPDYLSPEVYLPNDCIALPPSQSVKNAQNYAFYAGCRYTRDLFNLISPS